MQFDCASSNSCSMQVLLPRGGLSLSVAGISQCIAKGITYQEYSHPAKKLKNTYSARETANISTEAWQRAMSLLERDAHETELQALVHHSRAALQSCIEDFPSDEEQHRIIQIVHSAATGRQMVDPSTNRSLLHYLAMNGVHDLIRKFVIGGFQVDYPDSDRRTPLHLASIGCHFETVTTLVSCGADVHSRDTNGCFPWDYACSIDMSRPFQRNKEIEQNEILRHLALLMDIDQMPSRKSREMLEKMKDPETNLAYY